MNKKTLGIIIEGEIVGTINILIEERHLQIIASNKILSNGNYLFTEQEIRDMIIKKLSKQYEGKNIEINYQD